MYKTKPKAPAQWKQADDDQIPFVAILAPAELEKGTVRIKKQIGREAALANAAAAETAGNVEVADERGEEVPVAQVVEYLKTRLGGANL